MGLPDRFEVRGVLAMGGMGRIFEALDRESGQQVVVKMIRAGDGRPTHRWRGGGNSWKAVETEPPRFHPDPRGRMNPRVGSGSSLRSWKAEPCRSLSGSDGRMAPRRGRRLGRRARRGAPSGPPSMGSFTATSRPRISSCGADGHPRFLGFGEAALGSAGDVQAFKSATRPTRPRN